MTPIGCWRFRGTPTQNVAVTVGNNKTTPLHLDYILGEIMKPGKSHISESSGSGISFAKWNKYVDCGRNDK